MRVRTKVLAAVVLMSLLGMLVTGFLSYIAQFQIISASTTEQIENEIEEFRTFAQTGLDPDTGESFASVERLLRVVMQRSVPERTETYLSILNGVPLEFDGGDRPIRLETEPEVLRAVDLLGSGPDVVITDVETSAGTARIGIIPVGVSDGEDRGHFVIAYALDRQFTTLLRLGGIYLIASLLSLLLVGLVAWRVTGRLLLPLKVLQESAERISGTDLTERIPERGNDDITELTHTYNAMLDRLQVAIETQRQFLDDAGHELRTPITILRGHLELLDPEDPEEVSDTRALLVDEIDRMGRLVEDLILLSKSRRPDFVIPDVVHLRSFTEDLLEKVRALGDRHWGIQANADAVVLADPHRLTQAMIELAHNAVKYSDQGSAVRIGSRVTSQEVLLWVRDEGRGIAEEDVRSIFDRFSRVSTGRGVEGSGLGLSIVAAIAEAHGGRVTVDSQLAAGSTFTIVIPRRGLDRAADDGGADDHPVDGAGSDGDTQPIATLETLRAATLLGPSTPDRSPR